MGRRAELVEQAAAVMAQHHLLRQPLVEQTLAEVAVGVVGHLVL
jgi:hypothetical protein